MKYLLSNKYFFLLLIMANMLFAQQKVSFEQLSVPDGLSSNTIYEVVQDKYGFLWIATADGLNRYDGYKIDVFKHDPTDSLSLPANVVAGVFEDSNGILWAATTRGLAERDPDTGNFTTYIPETAVAEREQFMIQIYEDRQKRLWVGSRYRGIYLFDRETKLFERLMVEETGSASYRGGPHNLILHTASGEIYCGNFIDGLIRFNEQKRLFEQIDLKPHFPDNFIWDLHEDKSGNLWIASDNGLYKYQTAHGYVEKINIKSGRSDVKTIRALHEDKDGTLWIGSQTGLFTYNLRSGEIKQYTRANQGEHHLNNPAIWDIYEDKFDVLWIATLGGGLNKYDRTKISFDNYADFTGEINDADVSATYAIAPDSRNRNHLWIGTNTGLWSMDRDKKMAQKISLPKNIGDDQVGDLVRDANDILWIGTLNNGLIKYDIKNNYYNNFRANPYQREGLYENRIFDLVQDDYGDLWIGTSGGLCQLESKTEEISRVSGLDNRVYDAKIHSFIDDLHQNQIPLGSILEVADMVDETKNFSIENETAVIFISTGEGRSDYGMELYDYGWIESSEGDTVISMTDLAKTFHLGGDSKNRIQASILTLSPGKYQLRYKSDDSHSYGKWNELAPQDSSWWGVQVFALSETQEKSYAFLLDRDLNKPYIEGRAVMSLCYSRSGDMWIGTDQGLSRYNPRSGNVINYRHDPRDKTSLSAVQVDDILEDRNGIFWLATNRGLNRFDPQTEIFSVYYEKDGLPTDQIRAIAEDKSGNLWISSINGITKLEHGKGSEKPLFVNYDVQDGLQGYEFFWGSYVQFEDGEILFGGRNGFNAFYPGVAYHSEPRVVISEFSISNQVIISNSEDSPLTKPIMDTEKVVLDHDQNDLSFAFGTLHYSRPAKNTIAFRMRGYQEEWINDDRRFVTFTNLDPGEYVFEIKGISGDGIAAKDNKSIQILINHPWWRTTWAYFLYGFIFLAAIFGIDRIQRYRLTLRERSRSQLKEAELRAQAAEAEAKALAIEHDRKTHELEEARNLQLSLLPQNLPQLPNLEIAVYMKTATEVGGDYYDFNISADGTLNVALGDATGHGMKAGTMVTLMKGLFSADSGRMDIDDFFKQSSDTIKDLRFGRVMMAFTLLKIKDKNLLFSSAGMPPALIFRAATLKVDELTVQGMPLGAMKDINYQVVQESLEEGDSILLLSDGLPELKNPDGQIFDYDRVEKIFCDIANKPPQEVIDRLVDAGEVWRKDLAPDDDITLMVIRAK